MVKSWYAWALFGAPFFILSTPADAQARRSLPLNSPSNSCVTYSNSRVVGEASDRLKITSSCPKVQAVICTFRSVANPAQWDCRGAELRTSGTNWTMPFPHEPAAIYYVGACRWDENPQGPSDNWACINSSEWLRESISGRQDRNFNPASLRPPVDRYGNETCGFTIDGLCYVGERG